LTTSADYRDCHTGNDAAQGYQRTYASGYYAAQWERLEKPLLASLFAERKAAGARRMLDIACGQGRITLFGAEFFDFVQGIDYSPEMLAVARERSTIGPGSAARAVRFDVADVSQFTADEPFDVITAFRFFLNAGESLRREALNCVRRNIAPGGVLITNVHVSAASPLGLYWSARNAAGRLVGKPHDPVRNVIALSDFRRLLASEGFEITSVVRYSLLPRIGRLTDSFAERHIEQFDRLATIPVLGLLCQSYLVSARLRDAGA
jgi:ubiquinone/menaquinone biosynthesis C-methylase UbiE